MSTVAGLPEPPRWPLKSRQSVTPFADRMLVLMERKTEHKVGGSGVAIVLPEQAKERPEYGTVVVVGPDVTADVEPGARVLVSRYGGVPVNIEGHKGKFLVLRQSDVLGRVDELPEEFWAADDDETEAEMDEAVAEIEPVASS